MTVMERKCMTMTIIDNVFSCLFVFASVCALWVIRILVRTNEEKFVVFILINCFRFACYFVGRLFPIYNTFTSTPQHLNGVLLLWRFWQTITRPRVTTYYRLLLLGIFWCQYFCTFTQLHFENGTLQYWYLKKKVLNL